MARLACLSHRDVAKRLVDAGHTHDLPRDDARLAYLIVVAFEGTGIRLCQVPSTSAEDFEDIRFEHRLLCEEVEARAAVAGEARLQ